MGSDVDRIGDLRCYRSIVHLPERPDMAFCDVGRPINPIVVEGRM